MSSVSWGLLTTSALLAFLAGAGSGVEAGAEADRTSRTCFQPYPMRFEQEIDYAFGRAFAVFSGKVRTIEKGTVRITVTRVWKGKLGTEAAIPNGYRDTGRLADSKRKIAVLDQIVKRAR